MLKHILLVGLGGFFGSSLRYLTSYLVTSGHNFVTIPLGTLVVNIVGSLLIGIALVALKSESWYYFSVVGLCGGFTTFSAFSAESLKLLRDGMWSSAIAYILISVVMCIAATALGAYLGSKLIILK